MVDSQAHSVNKQAKDIIVKSFYDTLPHHTHIQYEIDVFLYIFPRIIKYKEKSMDNEGIIKYHDENKKVNEDQEGLLGMPNLFLNGSRVILIWRLVVGGSENGFSCGSCFGMACWAVWMYSIQYIGTSGSATFLQDILPIGFPFLESLSLT